MITLARFVALLYYVLHVGDCGTLPAAQQAEQTLITSLLNAYNKNIRPEELVSVSITAALKQILTLDEKQQIMTSSSYISQTWNDDRLSWTPNSSNNIEVVMLPVKSLWLPDTMILNSGDTSGYLTVSDYSLASVLYTGKVNVILPTLAIKTRCNLYVRKFPFDQQLCTINLTSWSQGANRVIYIENSSEVLDLTEYSEHPLWKLTGTDVILIEAGDRAPFESTYNDVISIQLYLERKPLYFMMNGIFACLVLNCVTLLSYYIPFGTQIGLCMTCFMTYSVYSLNFSSLFPQQSEYLMIITLYFLLSMSWTLISMTWFIICNHFLAKAAMPVPLVMFSGLLQRLFACCLKLLASCTARINRIHNFAKNQQVAIEDAESTKTKPNDTNSNQTVPIRSKASNYVTLNGCVWSDCNNIILPVNTYSNDCSKLEVPLNYAKPNDKKITISMARLSPPSQQTTMNNTLFILTGGPGGSGLSMIPYVDFFSHLLMASIMDSVVHAQLVSMSRAYLWASFITKRFLAYCQFQLECNQYFPAVEPPPIMVSRLLRELARNNHRCANEYFSRYHLTDKKLRSLFLNMIASNVLFYDGTVIPAIIFRLNPYNQEDVIVLKFFFETTLGTPESTSENNQNSSPLVDSLVLLFNIVQSGLCLGKYEDEADDGTILAWDTSTLISADH
ncbi:unnamed protein product [Rotaria socialis]|uniref:Neurotransmitter-gated ion-channel ligand-binding domain-containing protein n=1 Tax=Rotaria socialis TaxID=392032 RepID=A0A821HCR2_9BILA|nr:unnamed protein product [Rotaria socialis]